MLSTFERKMKNPKFKKAFNKIYKELLLSELLIKLVGKVNNKKEIKHVD